MDKQESKLEQLKALAEQYANQHQRKWYLISGASWGGPEREMQLHDSRHKLPHGYNIDWVAFPRR